MHSSPLRGGLIGCGFVSQHHLEGWKSVPGAQIVALCDLDPSRLEHAAARMSGVRLYTDASAMFREESLDFVELCTRPDSHRPLVSEAAAHGVHVLCQKPVAARRDDLLAMIATSEQAKIRLMVHENWRFRPWYRIFRKQLETGVVGQPIRLRLFHRDPRALRLDGFKNQPYFAEMPQLILLEMGCHLVDTARFLLGEIVTVTATAKRFGNGHPGEDLATLSLEFTSGALGLLDMTWCAPSEADRSEWALNETVVEGTEGTLRLLPDGSLERRSLTGERERISVDLPPDDQVYVGGYVATQRHFIEGLRTGAPHETSAVDTLKTMDVVWTGYQSAEERRTLVVPSFNGPRDAANR